ncbi:MAG: phosphotransferase [Myxococcales bacterium]|nr:phosphotransferase [Myxococcales bacterium]
MCSRYAKLAGRNASPLGTGLINDTFVVEAAGERVVLQRVHKIFGPSVHDDIEAVTARVQQRGMTTPRLVRADDGGLYVRDREDRVWRAMTFVDGVAFDKADSPARVREAGSLVARWHQCLKGWSYEYAHVRAGAHDTQKHLRVLREALDARREHRLHAEVASFAEPLLRAAEGLPELASNEPIHAHGDLKLSNLMFDSNTGAGVCLVDLDTVAKMPWAFEMGDALRSWCNPAGENVTEATVDRALFRAALEGYGQGAKDATQTERDAWAEQAADGLGTIALELAARFLGDALIEGYFGWDPKRFPARGEHNLVRGRGQWSLAKDAIAHRDALVEEAKRALVG